MGRVKLEIKKIENPTNRQVTYSKRRNGLIKKAFELSVLCDVDIAVIMFSPSGKLTSFSKDDRIEEVLNRFAETPHHERTKRRFENVQYINKIVQKLADERGVETQGLAFGDHQHEVQELRSSLNKAIAEKEFYAQKSRLFKGDAYLQGIDSVPSLLTIQRELEQALVKVHDRKAQLEDESQYRQGGLSNYQRFQAVQDKPQERKFQIEDDAQLTAFGQNRIQQSSSFGQQLVTVPARDGTASALTEGRNASSSADGAQGSQTHAWHHRVEEQFDNSPAVLSSSQMRDSAGFTSEATSAYYHRSPIPPVFRGNQLEGRAGQGASNAEYSFGAKIEAGAPFGYETAGHAQIMPMSGHGKQVQLTGDVEFPFYSGMQQQHQSHGAWQGQIDLSSSSSTAQASSSSYRGPLIPPGGSRPGTQDQNLGNFNDENYEASGYYNKGY